MVSKKLKGEDVNWDEEYVKPILEGVETFRTYIERWYDGTLHEIFFSDQIDQSIKIKYVRHWQDMFGINPTPLNLV